MFRELEIINNQIFRKHNLILSEIESDLECGEYLGLNLKLNEVSIKFRKGKMTQKKPGFFVTFWKRNLDGITEPFHSHDDFELLLIAAENQEKFGVFVFPKSFLIESKILKNNTKGGKRGFRIYNHWSKKLNFQAENTKNSQSHYFIDFSENENLILEKFQKITTHIFK